MGRHIAEPIRVEFEADKGWERVKVCFRSNRDGKITKGLRMSSEQGEMGL